MLSRTAFRAARVASASAPLPSIPSIPSVSFVAKRAYHQNVIDHYTNPRNPGSLDKADPNVGTGLVGAPACGDVMKLQIRVDEATGTISEAKFKTFGCGSAIASSSYLTTLVKGMRLEDAAKIRNVDISKELCLPPVKLHCSMLAEDAIKAAIANYHTKNPRIATNLAGTAKSIIPEAEPVASV